MATRGHASEVGGPSRRDHRVGIAVRVPHALAGLPAPGGPPPLPRDRRVVRRRHRRVEGVHRSGDPGQRVDQAAAESPVADPRPSRAGIEVTVAVALDRKSLGSESRMPFSHAEPTWRGNEPVTYGRSYLSKRSRTAG